MPFWRGRCFLSQEMFGIALLVHVESGDIWRFFGGFFQILLWNLLELAGTNAGGHAGEEIFNKGTSRRIWGELYKAWSSWSKGLAEALDIHQSAPKNELIIEGIYMYL